MLGLARTVAQPLSHCPLLVVLRFALPLVLLFVLLFVLVFVLLFVLLFVLVFVLLFAFPLVLLLVLLLAPPVSPSLFIVSSSSLRLGRARAGRMAKLVRSAQGLARTGGMPTRPRWLDVVERFPPTHPHGRAAAVPVLDWPIPQERQLEILGLQPVAAANASAAPAGSAPTPAPGPSPTTTPTPELAKTPAAARGPGLKRGPGITAAPTGAPSTSSAAAATATPIRGTSELDRLIRGTLSTLDSKNTVKAPAS